MLVFTETSALVAFAAELKSLAVAGRPVELLANMKGFSASSMEVLCSNAFKRLQRCIQLGFLQKEGKKEEGRMRADTKSGTNEL